MTIDARQAHLYGADGPLAVIRPYGPTTPKLPAPDDDGTIVEGEARELPPDLPPAA